MSKQYNVYKNVDYVGCFGDFAYFNPAFRPKKYYQNDFDHKGVSIDISKLLNKINKHNNSTVSVYKKEYTSRLPNIFKKIFHYYGDGPARYIPSIDSVLREEDHPKYLTTKRAISRCYEKALLQGKQYFALQDNGICMATNDSSVVHEKSLPKERCESGIVGDKNGKAHYEKGGYYTNSVFKIKDMSHTYVDDMKEGPKDAFLEYTYKEPVIKNAIQMECVQQQFFPLSASQKFTQMYFTPTNPIKGMLLYKSAGSGKTCEVVNAAGNFMFPPKGDEEQWNIFWVTRKTQKNVPHEALFSDICLEKLRRIIEDDDTYIEKANGDVIAKTRSEKIESIKGGSATTLLKNMFGISLNKTHILSYDDFVDFIWCDRTEELKKLNKDAYTRSKDLGSDDLGYKTLIIVDEAHNLLEGVLPTDERLRLDKKYEGTLPLLISGKQFCDKSDIYGKDIANGSGVMTGRDMISALMNASAEKSNANSAKILLMTATPHNVFEMMNLMIPEHKDKLDTNLSNYYNVETKSLNDEKMLKFANAAYGRLSYLNTTNNPTEFSRKLYAGTIRVNAHPFHLKMIRKAVNKLNGKDDSSIISIYRNMSICAQTRGPFYSPDQLKTYRNSLARIDKYWTEENERKYQTKLYLGEVTEARKVFNLLKTAKDQKIYNKRVSMFEKWEQDRVQYEHKLQEWLEKSRRRGVARKPGKIPSKPVITDELRSVMSENESLKPFELWEPLKSNGRLVITPGKHSQLKEEYTRKSNIYDFIMEHYEGGVSNIPFKFRDIMDSAGDKLTVEHFINKKVGLQPKDQFKYNKISEKYKQYKTDYEHWKNELKNKHKWESTGGGKMGLRPISPIMDKDLSDATDKKGQLLSVEDWYMKVLYKDRRVKNKVKYSDEEKKYLKYLINDPATGQQRLRTLEEFINVKLPVSEFYGEPEDKSVDFMFWKRKFNPSRILSMLPIYAPVLDSLISNIIKVEKKHVDDFKYGTKHLVFTFSVSEKDPSHFRDYGSKTVLSAFAAHPDFEIMVQYEVGEEGGTHRNLVNNNRNGKMGVTTMSSSSINTETYLKNKQKSDIVEPDSYPGVVNYTSFNIQTATKDAFNHKDNIRGDQIKIIVLDGAFMEGVSLYDVGFVHFLSPGQSKSELVQAVGRSSRKCKSTNIPFFKGLGAFTKMYFYELYDNTNSVSMYSEMMSHITDQSKRNNNLTDAFETIASDLSIEHHLLKKMHDFDPVYTGKIKGFDAISSNSYVIEMDVVHVETTPLTVEKKMFRDVEVSMKHEKMKADRKNKQKEDKTKIMNMDIIVYPSYIKGANLEWHVGDSVCNPFNNGKGLPSEGVIRSISLENAKCDVLYMNVLQTESISDLRLTIGSSVEFRIPNGVDTAQRVFDIASYKDFNLDKMTGDFIDDIEVPEAALEVVQVVFNSTPRFMLLGMMGMLNIIKKSGGAGLPIHIVLPHESTYYKAPDLNSFAIKWECSGKQSRKLVYSDKLIEDFLRPTKGISILFLVLSNPSCLGNEDTHYDHVNLLIYSPEWNTIERFDPRGRVFHSFDTIKLDARLTDFFKSKNKHIVYMSTATASPLKGLETIQKLEMKNSKANVEFAKLGSFSVAFALLYLQTRIIYMARKSKSDNPMLFPITFQRGLIISLDKELQGNLTGFIKSYAGQLALSHKSILKSKEWNNELPFWSNIVIQLKSSLKMIAMYRHKMPKVKSSSNNKEEDENTWNKVSKTVDTMVSLFKMFDNK